MKLLSYELKIRGEGNWSFSKVNFGSVNLLVGDSGSGKTRFLNTIFNLARYVSSTEGIGNGNWKLELQLQDSKYLWELEVERLKSSELYVNHEYLVHHIGDNKEILVERNKSSWFFAVSCGKNWGTLSPKPPEIYRLVANPEENKMMTRQKVERKIVEF